MSLELMEKTLTEGQKDIEAARASGNEVLVEVLTGAWMMLFNQWQELKAVAA